jgi:hypothetical protein
MIVWGVESAAQRLGPTIMDRSCVATILSEVEQTCNTVGQGLLQNNQAIFQVCFSFCPR